jgi:hypothetical protein
MPNRLVHNRICTCIIRDRDICDKVNGDKDIASKRMPGIAHRQVNHGPGSNLKYLRKYGIKGFIAGKIHDRLDQLFSCGK